MNHPRARKRHTGLWRRSAAALACVSRQVGLGNADVEMRAADFTDPIDHPPNSAQRKSFAIDQFCGWLQFELALSTGPGAAPPFMAFSILSQTSIIRLQYSFSLAISSGLRIDMPD